MSAARGGLAGGAIAARRWRTTFGLCAGAVVAALAFVTATALRLEREGIDAASRARQRETQDDLVRTSLWRLDSALLTLLAREGARAYFEYLPYYPQECGYSRYLSPISKGDVLVASPLLLFAPPPFRLHFQVGADGRFGSPQAPQGSQLDLALATCSVEGLASRAPAAADPWFARVATLVVPAEVERSIAAAESLEQSLPHRWRVEAEPAARGDAAAQRGRGEWVARQQQMVQTKLSARNDASANNRIGEPSAAIAPPRVEVGTLVPLWLGGGDAELFFFRRVEVDAQPLLQGIWVDWPQLKSTLLASIADLLPGADLVPLRELGANFAEGESSALTTLPARLVAAKGAAAAVVVAATGLTAERITLLVAWGAVAAALVGGWLFVRSSVALGERRSRFASAVTHELRTPLTTFRMYSEMLAEGIVTDPAQRQLYLETLQAQSTRLSTLVENVLAFARLEERRGVARRERVVASALVLRHRDALARRVADARLELVVEIASDVAEAPLETDVDAVGQVALNLVDNACKYAREARAPITLRLERRGRRVALVVADRGPGVPSSVRRAIFEPFERGARNGDPAPGVGLGLALARGIARDLGGDLLLESGEAEAGARFALLLPLAG